MVQKQNRQTGIKQYFPIVYNKTIAIVFLSFCLIVFTIFLYIKTFLLPNTAELENPNYEIASDFISSDGKIFGKVFKYNREWLDLSLIHI